MTAFSKARAWTVSGCAAISLIAFSPLARAEVLFDSLHSPNTGVGDGAGGYFQADASFATVASTFYATDVALLLAACRTALILADDRVDCRGLDVGGSPIELFGGFD